MAQWFTYFNQQTRQYPMSIDRAILGGRCSLNVGFAFAAGYQSAIEALFCSSEPEGPQLSSFCVTELKGNHPSAIEASLYETEGKLFVDGHKRFISGANDAQVIYVVCRDQRFGDDFEERNTSAPLARAVLKVVKIPTNHSGVNIEAMPALGFVPEVSHGQVHLDHVALSETQILSGDGYSAYVKAFRSHEDLHVLAAITAYRLGEAIDFEWGSQLVEAHLSLLVSLRAISFMPLSEPGSHILLSATRQQLMQLIAQSNAIFEAKSPDSFLCWQRDQVLLDLANKAQHARTEKAWRNFS
jgi:hypothetical protein